MMSRDPSAARLVFAYLAAGDPLPAGAADAVIGFGHFDLGIPRQCAVLAQTGRAERIVFTGGVGAGSGGFQQPEAREFLDELVRVAAELKPRVAVVEDRSTNTGENVRFTTELLARVAPDLAPGRGLRRALLVATPCRMRRVVATVQRHWPEVQLFAAPAPATYEEQEELYRRQGLDLVAQLAGEIERLRAYPAKGFCAPVAVPPAVLAAAAELGASPPA